VSFIHPAATVHAVRDVSYALEQGKAFGLAGASGCGKTTSARALLGLLPGAFVSGELGFSTGERYDLSDQRLSGSTLAPLRGRRIALTFQEPTAALDPLRRVGAQVAEVAALRGRASHRNAQRRAIEIMRRVGLEDAEATARAYPHELSGGMRQRAALALAFACDPEVLIADEPTTALDSLLQARVLGLLREVGLEGAKSLELITHDLSVLRAYADRIAVMFAGRIVEQAPAHELVEQPLHPHTRALLASAKRLLQPTNSPAKVPALSALLAPSPGCSFSMRCAHRTDICAAEEPKIREARPDHFVACWQDEDGGG
jgi:oligopeptide/dipeptide ABC transporter ATP-binding protein